MNPILEQLESLIETERLAETLAEKKSAGVFLPLGAAAFVVKKLAAGRSVIYTARDDLEAEEVYESLLSLGADARFFPDVDVIPYSNVFPSADKLSDRIETLAALSQGRQLAVVMTLEALLRKLPPVSAMRQTILHLKTGDRLERDAWVAKLISMSYIRDAKVTQPGTFSVRGDIVDVYPPGMKEGVRVSFFGDEVEHIKAFNPVTQLSDKTLDELNLIPASEFALTPEIMKPEWEQYRAESHSHSHFTKFYQSTGTILDYSGPDTILCWHEAIEARLGDLQKKQRELTPPGEATLLNDPQLLMGEKSPCARLTLLNRPPEDNLSLSILPPPEFGEGFSRFVADLEQVYLPDGFTVYIIVEYHDLAERLMNILKKLDPVLQKERSHVPQGKKLLIMQGALEHGFTINSGGRKIMVLTESDVSGKKRLFRKRIRQIDTIFEDIEDIQVGESVVHLNYGIGIFKGIERVNVLGKEKDYILLEFSDKEKLFVPLEQSNLIGKYIGGATKKPPLDSLGGKSWAKKRAKVQASIEEFARKLVAIYAKRAAMMGHTFAKDTVWQKEFEDKFEYIETPDQVKVIEEIKRDMEHIRPMDRLLCGDVGFGKTEVAMRAAFKAVMDGVQVAVIAPTTVLVEQHYYTFMKRFEGFPVRIEYMSRFTEPGEVRRILKQLADHQVDIVVGTHKLFSEKVKFHSLGLVIIDEEHKFGVNHKEVLKERYPLVDFLALSATPIPRTLNMAMATIRDISLLQTPPDMRIPVETIVSDYTPELVKYSIEKELARGGQVYFVHNTIKRLNEYAFLIEEMVPGAKVCIGHGQMEEEELDRAFMGFVRGDYNVFVCTTIIDAGLDIPNANTIIISDANRFGLSQLYQLKGRVGRAKKQGYAYFLYPANRSLTETAQKRLFVINEYTDLGAGFNIALQDLEIRGAGNILGAEQHGNMIAVGYDVYMRLLREEVEKLKGEHVEKVETLIDLKYDAFIPAAYISDSPTKMEIYKKILSVRSEEEIRQLTEELTDRFGMIPAEVSTLFEISRLKISAEALGIEMIIEKGEFIEISFSKFSRVDAVKVMNVKATGKHEITIKPHEKHKIFYKSFDSGIAVKVKRMAGFMKDIMEEVNN